MRDGAPSTSAPIPRAESAEPLQLAAPREEPGTTSERSLSEVAHGSVQSAEPLCVDEVLLVTERAVSIFFVPSEASKCQPPCANSSR